MTPDERKALLWSGVVIGKIHYNDVTNVILLPQFMWRFDLSTFPSMKTFDEVFHNTASNTTVLTFRGKDIGLRLMSNSIKGDSLSIALSHPASAYWISILQPIWDKQNADKCKTCFGSGWDGCGYTLSCAECGGSGKTNATESVNQPA